MLPRRLQLRELRVRLHLQVLVLERDRSRRADRLDQLGVVVERRVVDQRRYLAAVAADRRDRPIAAGGRQDDRIADRIGVPCSSR